MLQPLGTAMWALEKPRRYLSYDHPVIDATVGEQMTGLTAPSPAAAYRS